MSKGENKEVIGLIKDELGGKIITTFDGWSPKTHSYLIDDSSEDKKAKHTKECVIKEKFIFKNYQKFLKATQIENKINHLEKIKLR